MESMRDAWIEHRFGKFEVSAELLQDISMATIGLLFSDMVIYSVKSNSTRNSLTYYACSPKFEPLSPNTPPPWYDVSCTMEPCDIGGHANRIIFERIRTHAA